jgi:hypothetical protein
LFGWDRAFQSQIPSKTIKPAMGSEWLVVTGARNHAFNREITP